MLTTRNIYELIWIFMGCFSISKDALLCKFHKWCQMWLLLSLDMKREVSVTLASINVSCHYDDVIMGAMASQITSLTIVYSIVYSGADQRKHESSASLAFVQGIHRGPRKWPATRKMFPFDDVIMMDNCHYWCIIVNIPLSSLSKRILLLYITG